jgi:hypothetical protein
MLRGLAIVAALVLPVIAHAQMPQPTVSDLQTGMANAASDLSNLIVNLRIQLVADQREIASLQKQLEDAKKAAPTPQAPPK